MAATNFHRVQPIVKVVETMGKNPWFKTCTKCAGAENYNKIYRKLATKRKHLPKTQEKSPTVRRTKNTKSVEEALEKAHPPRRTLTITNCKHHRTTTIL